MLSRLVLTDFRNHADAAIEPGPGFVVLTGENGAGKTNILEAVSAACAGAGPASRAAGRDGAAGRQRRFWRGGHSTPYLFFVPLPACGRVGRACRQTLAISDTPPPPPSPASGKEVMSPPAPSPPPPNAESSVFRAPPTAATALAEWLTVLWLTPAMDRLFVEPASERRRFLDRLTLALNPGHAVHSNRYEAAMRARNRLLAEANEGCAPPIRNG